MGKKYIDNYKLIGARYKIFKKLESEPSENIFEVIKLESGDFLPNKQIAGDQYKIYGGGGFTGKFHDKSNVRHYAIGIGRVGARCGCVFPIEPNSWVTDNALYSSNIKDGYNLEFLIHWLNYKSLNQYANTSAQPVISLKRISSVTIPKINFLMQEEIAKLLNKVINEEPIESDSWGVCDTLKTISYLEKYFAESDVQSNYLSLLRQSILQEAIEGKLTQAWRKKNSVRKGDPDFDANALLEKIQEEKKKMAEGKSKKEKPLAPIKPEEIPFPLPEGWIWVRLGEICQKIHYGFNASAKLEKKDIRLLRITDIQNNKVIWETVPGCDATPNDLKNYLLKPNDILIARTGGTIGKSFLVKDITIKALFASYLIRAIPSAKLDVEYLKFFLESPSYWSQLYKAAWGSGQPNVNGTSLINLKIPLPPLAEQQAIVARVDKLLAMVEELEKNVIEQKTKAEELMQAVLREAFD